MTSTIATVTSSIATASDTISDPSNRLIVEIAKMCEHSRRPPPDETQAKRWVFTVSCLDRDTRTHVYAAAAALYHEGPRHEVKTAPFTFYKGPQTVYSSQRTEVQSVELALCMAAEKVETLTNATGLEVIILSDSQYAVAKMAECITYKHFLPREHNDVIRAAARYEHLLTTWRAKVRFHWIPDILNGATYMAASTALNGILPEQLATAVAPATAPPATAPPAAAPMAMMTLPPMKLPPMARPPGPVEVGGFDSLPAPFNRYQYTSGSGSAPGTPFYGDPPPPRHG